MTKKQLLFGAPFFIFLAFLLDGQLSTMVTNWLPIDLAVASHALFIVGIFCSFQLPVLYHMSLFLLVGIVYDIYYLGVLGIATTLLPLVSYLMYYFYQQLKVRFLVNWVILIVVLFVFEFASFLLGRLFHLTNLSMFIFVFNNLVPSLVFNSLLLGLLHPCFKSVFPIMNKT